MIDVNGDRIRALRHDREIASAMRWHGMSRNPSRSGLAAG